MALTFEDKVKIELGLNYFEDVLITPEEIEYFGEKNNYSLRRTCLDVAKTLLFVLSQYVHEKSGPELEIWGHDKFRQYLDALKFYVSDPNFSVAISMAKAYGGGISITDIRDNIENVDNNVVEVDKAYPQDGEAANTSPTNYFDREYYSNNPFGI